MIAISAYTITAITNATKKLIPGSGNSGGIRFMFSLKVLFQSTTFLSTPNAQVSYQR
jgi:hypothetical protein